jgi:hypothetical protein
MTQILSPEERQKQPPLWKQLMGAVVGMMVALALYHGYKFAAPTVQAYLVPPGGFTRSALMGETAFSDKQVSSQSDVAVRIGARTQESTQDMLAQNPQPALGADVTADQPVQEEAAPVDNAPAAIAPLAYEPQAAVSTTHAAAESSSSLQTSSRYTLRALSDDTSSAVAIAAVDATHGGAPGLPSSGPGLWLACLGAIAGAFAMSPKMRMHAERLWR